MRNRFFVAVTLVALAAGCTSTIQGASIIEAHKHYANGQYGEALKLISQAESAKEMDVERRAKLTLLKARAYAGLGDTDRAALFYRYLQEQHPESQYAYQAQFERTRVP